MRHLIRQLFAYPLLVLLLCVATAVHAQTDRGLLWKVEKDGRTSYLLGTVHVWKRVWYPLNPTIEKAFTESKTLAVEADLETVDAAGAMQRMMLPGNETLASRLGTKLYEQTKAETDKIGIPEAAVNKFKPWGVMLVLAAGKLHQLGYTPDLGIDMYFLKKAKLAGKTVIELESGDQQLAMLDSLSDKLQVAMLTDYLAQSDRIRQVVDGIISGWKRGDADALYALNQKTFNDSEVKREFEDKFLYQRDVAMTRKIEELLQKPGPHFIAVGSLHLLGPRSIVEQLKAKGYNVTRL